MRGHTRRRERAEWLANEYTPPHEHKGRDQSKHEINYIYSLYPSLKMPGESQTDRSKSIYGNDEAAVPLPFFKFVDIPRNNNPMPSNPFINTETCGGKIISGALMGNIYCVARYA